MAQVILDPAKLAELLRSPNGLVMKQTIIFAEKVKQQTIRSMRSDFPRQFLGPSIVKRIVTDSRGGYVEVGSERVKTERHPIPGNPLLVFHWPAPKGPGRVVFLRHVDHPGSNFGPYLADKLLKALEAVRSQFGQ